MDDETCSLIGRNGTCSLELVNLILTGRAVSNVFDNNLQLGSCLLRGVSRRSDIGLLSLYEHYNSCQVIMCPTIIPFLILLTYILLTIPHGI